MIAESSKSSLNWLDEYPYRVLAASIVSSTVPAQLFPATAGDERRRCGTPP
jgi:hypothetical protein